MKITDIMEPGRRVDIESLGDYVGEEELKRAYHITKVYDIPDDDTIEIVMPMDHGKMIEEINTSICKLAPIIKDESFMEEQEWRLVSTATGGEKNMAFREGVFSLIPYLNFKICDQNSKDCLKRIVVGPSPHTDLATNSLSMFLKQNKLQKVEIVTSRIPFRNWK